MYQQNIKRFCEFRTYCPRVHSMNKCFLVVQMHVFEACCERKCISQFFITIGRTHASKQASKQACTHTHTHAHARTHARTHTHTHASIPPSIPSYFPCPSLLRYIRRCSCPPQCCRPDYGSTSPVRQ